MTDATIHHGEALKWLDALPDDCADAIITDPPYSSGGFTRGDRNADTVSKYSSDNRWQHRDGFDGDNRDARSWCLWCSLWLEIAMRKVRPGGYALIFTDWRQLPTLTDAFQCGGWLWRGLIAWDKGGAARAPHKGYFRHQCEFVVWGSRGGLPVAEHDGPYPGCYSIPVLQADKHHLTGKPTQLMRQLVRCVPPGGLVLDPFAGSGTTGVACAETGRRFMGCEQSERYVETARNRIASATPSLFAAEGVA